MASYIIRRALAGVVTIWAATVITFVVIQLPPGDFVTAYIANLQSTGTILSTAEAESLRIQYGLDRPIHVQYAKWMGLMLKGNFGMAMEYNRPVREVIGDRMLITIIVSLAAVIFIWASGAPHRHLFGGAPVLHRRLRFYLYRLHRHCHPQLHVGAHRALCVSFKYFDVQNIGGLFSPDMAMEPWGWPKIWDMMKHLPIPAVIIGMAGMAEVVRIMRANLLDELRNPTW
ncbi:MAG: ABC transporter permease [Caldilineaceae bacterium]